MEYKVNLHIIEACNYKCRHCFAKFNSNKILPLDEWKTIIKNIDFSIKEINIIVINGVSTSFFPYFQAF